MYDIIEGSLEVVEIHNGYALYGQDFGLHDVFLAHLGDGVDSFITDEDYDPNVDTDLPEAYGFNLV